MKSNHSKRIFILSLLASLGLVFIWACTIGPEKIPLNHSAKMVLSKIPGIKNFIDLSDVKSSHQIIFFVVRIPRVLLATLAGMALAGSGVVFQGVLRNPLAEPYVLGVSSGAAFGASLVIVTGVSISVLGLSSIAIGALLGALITIYVVYTIAKVGMKSSITTLLLSGIAVSFLLSSMVSLMIALNRDRIEQIIFWTMGSLNAAKMDQVQVVALPIIVCLVVFIFFSRDLNVLLLGEDSATSMGIDVTWIRKILLMTASMATALSVSVTGIIGFVGLIVPHAMRIILGPNHKYLTPASIISGAIFLIFSDTIARTIIAPGQLPLGVVTSVIGAPYFVYLLYKSNLGRA